MVCLKIDLDSLNGFFDNVRVFARHFKFLSIHGRISNECATSVARSEHTEMGSVLASEVSRRLHDLGQLGGGDFGEVGS